MMIAKKKKHRRTDILMVVGLVAIVIMQSLWLYNAYQSVRNDIQREINTVLVKAAREELRLRFKRAPKGTVLKEIMVAKDKKYNNEFIPGIISLNEGLSELGIALSLQRLDSLASGLLQEAEIDCPMSIELVHPDTEKVAEESRPDNRSWWVVQSEILPITQDFSQGVRLSLYHPNNAIVERMFLILVSSLLVMVLIAVCIVDQYRMIRRQDLIMQVRKDFSYALIHDMKTPLNTIMVVLGQLRSGRLDSKPEVKERFLANAESETKHLLALTNKVLVISKLESHKLEMVKTGVPLAPLLEERMEHFKVKAKKPVTFITDLKAETMYADREYLEEVIDNLIDNAIKYSKETVEIRISSESTGGHTLLKVRDNGEGIAKEYQTAIFHRFERGEAVRRVHKGGASGFGLGLNFVKLVVEAHGGKVWVESEKGVYSEFTVSLPNSI